MASVCRRRPLLAAVCRRGPLRRRPLQAGRVPVHVFGQPALRGEALPALLAAQPPGLGAGVAALVAAQLRRALELEVAHAAGVRPLARVDALVQPRLAQREEGLAAVGAGEGPLAVRRF